MDSADRTRCLTYTPPGQFNAIPGPTLLRLSLTLARGGPLSPREARQPRGTQPSSGQGRRRHGSAERLPRPPTPSSQPKGGQRGRALRLGGRHWFPHGFHSPKRGTEPWGGGSAERSRGEEAAKRGPGPRTGGYGRGRGRCPAVTRQPRAATAAGPPRPAPRLPLAELPPLPTGLP